MKSLISYINESNIFDIKKGTVVYYRQHDSDEIHELTVETTNKEGAYIVCTVQDNVANIDVFGIREKISKDGIHSVWVITKNDEDTHGFLSFAKDILNNKISDELKKKIDDVMSKISNIESKISKFNSELTSLNKERAELEKKLNA